ncbi:MAG: glycosyltransferase family 2 protein [bacterium]|uniref:Glycosyltransferase family 2 protein n=1 Tax=Candidatus Aphodosoma intestinipullorum TaxID=2840674 RepID=A0A940IE96_9BACT|nr:glycosyltransferase family 2 protein [Candidatus Aphodosoma intestinipullorum]
MSQVSILVCVYNTEKYIGRCAESLFGQTLRDVEYIFVDDSSTDNSIGVMESVLARYPERREQMRTIRLAQNIGPEFARMTAAEHAAGDYLMFVDSDDYAEPDMAERLYRTAVETGADIVACDFLTEYQDGRRVYCNEYVAAGHEERFREMLINKDANGYMWNKLYRTGLFRQCHYPGKWMCYLEDYAANIQLYYYAERVEYVAEPLYHYMKNGESITAAKRRRHFEDAVEFWRRTDSFLMEKGLYDRYNKLTDRLKVEMTAHLMMDTDDRCLRRVFSRMFREEERKTGTAFLRRGERWMLWAVRHELFRLSDAIRWAVVMKEKIRKLLKFR